MKMTPFLAIFNTLLALVLGLYFTLAVGVAGSNPLMGDLLALVQLIFITAVVTGWIVAIKGSGVNKIVLSAWRIAQTLSALILLAFILGCLSNIFGIKI